MFGVMTEADPYGFFVQRTGQPVNLQEFASRIVVPIRVVRRSLVEIIEKGVGSKDSAERIYCRRLVRDYAKYVQNIENGKAGGNPTLLPDNPRDNPNPDNPLVIPGVKARARQSQKLKDLGNSDSLRSSALAVKTWPSTMTGLGELAMTFLARFGNCYDPVKAEKFLPPYVSLLGVMRSRRVPIAEAWQACEDALVANNRKPLFGAQVKTALSFLLPDGMERPKPTTDDQPAWLTQAFDRGKAERKRASA